MLSDRILIPDDGVCQDPETAGTVSHDPDTAVAVCQDPDTAVVLLLLSGS